MKEEGPFSSEQVSSDSNYREDELKALARFSATVCKPRHPQSSAQWMIRWQTGRGCGFSGICVKHLMVTGHCQHPCSQLAADAAAASAAGDRQMTPFVAAAAAVATAAPAAGVRSHRNARRDRMNCIPPLNPVRGIHARSWSGARLHGQHQQHVYTRLDTLCWSSGRSDGSMVG